MKPYLKKLMNREHLTVTEMKEAANYCFTTDVTETEIAGFLTALQIKGETADGNGADDGRKAYEDGSGSFDGNHGDSGFHDTDFRTLRIPGRKAYLDSSFHAD